MGKARRKLTKEFKLKVILEALQERTSMKEIAQKYKIHPNQITTWKKDFLDKAMTIMDAKKVSSIEKDNEKELEVLYSKIGKLLMEIDFLKKNLY